jgi:hypothetical protein
MGLEPPIIAFTVASFVCLLIVARQMARREGTGQALLGIVTVVYAFLWGWRHPKIRVSSLRLRDVMTTWTWCAGSILVLLLILWSRN